ncbi:MAG: hypothetical protein H0T79_10440, partial [Deltaproteobacteria bacterium]|nr:hypothetical protein [Deltaproteobacteria bacterium]
MTENLVLAPSDGAFDLDRLRSRLDSQPDALLDPCGSGTYMLCGDPERVPMYDRARRQDPSRFFYLPLIFSTPEQVLVNQESGDAPQLRSALEVVRWMVAELHATIRTDEGARDLSELVRRDGVESLYPSDVAEAPLPWAD